MNDQPLGNPALPRYYHHGTELVEHITGHSIRNRNAAKRRLTNRVKAAGGDPNEIKYRAGMGPGLLGGRR